MTPGVSVAVHDLHLPGEAGPAGGREGRENDRGGYEPRECARRARESPRTHANERGMGASLLNVAPPQDEIRNRSRGERCLGQPSKLGRFSYWEKG